MTSNAAHIADNVGRVREQIAAACAKARRDPRAVRLVAVTKYARLKWVRTLVELGIRDLGESRPQQLLERAAHIDADVDWHLVGHLQRNKARRVLPLTALIHSVDTFRLLETLERLAGALELRPRVLLEVNVSGEPQKHGFPPDELLDGWEQIVACERVQVDGLMTMAPLLKEMEQVRPVFRRLRELRNRLRGTSPPELHLPELSMGMSGDFPVAVEEGATIVRIGSRLFEGLTDNDDR